MEYKNITEGRFLSRPNRFTAVCEIDGRETTVHVKNTGRCRELLVPGAKVFLEKSGSPARKTPCSLVAVMKGNRLINMDSQAPNAAVLEGLKSGAVDLGLGKITRIKPETVYGSSRFDFYAETASDKIFIEVKGVTLEKDNAAMFPDAPTERGVKHVKELIKAVSEGYKAFIIFVIQMKNPSFFTPNRETHEEFAEAVRLSAEKGVSVLAYDCLVRENGMEIDDKIRIIL